MSEDTVPASDVIKVLKRSRGVFIAPIDEEKQLYAIEGQGFMEAAVLKGRIGKRFLFRLNKKLKIPIHFFWHPEMMGGGEED